MTTSLYSCALSVNDSLRFSKVDQLHIHASRTRFLNARKLSIYVEELTIIILPPETTVHLSVHTAILPCCGFLFLPPNAVSLFLQILQFHCDHWDIGIKLKTKRFARYWAMVQLKLQRPSIYLSLKKALRLVDCVHTRF